MAKHGVALQRSLNELDGLRVPAESGEKLKAVNERATLFRITSNAMINVSARPVGRGHSLPAGWSGLPLPTSPMSHHPPPRGQAGSLAHTVGWSPELGVGPGGGFLGTGGRAEQSSEPRVHSGDAAATLPRHSCCPDAACPGPVTRGARACGVGGRHWGGSLGQQSFPAEAAAVLPT